MLEQLRCDAYGFDCDGTPAPNWLVGYPTSQLGSRWPSPTRPNWRPHAIDRPPAVTRVTAPGKSLITPGSVDGPRRTGRHAVSAGKVPWRAARRRRACRCTAGPERSRPVLRLTARCRHRSRYRYRGRYRSRACLVDRGTAAARTGTGAVCPMPVPVRSGARFVRPVGTAAAVPRLERGTGPVPRPGTASREGSSMERCRRSGVRVDRIPDGPGHHGQCPAAGGLFVPGCRSATPHLAFGIASPPPPQRCVNRRAGRSTCRPVASDPG